MTIVREYARKSQTIASPRSRPRAILDSNLKVSNNKIGNEKNKQTNKQQMQQQQKTNKKTKQNKTKLVELENFLGEVRKRN